MIKDFQQKLIAQVDDIKIPTLEHFLSKLYASSASKDNTCEYCDYVAKNTRALTAHHRGCAQRKQHFIDKQERLTTEFNKNNEMKYDPNNV